MGNRQNPLDPAGVEVAGDNEIGLQGDAQSLRRGLGQHVAIVGVDPAAHREVLGLPVHQELPAWDAGHGYNPGTRDAQFRGMLRSTVAGEVIGGGDDQQAAAADLARHVAGLEPRVMRIARSMPSSIRLIRRSL
jgi:hypothetical protein